MGKKEDLFCPSRTQDYNTYTVEQPALGLSHCCGIFVLALPSHGTYIEDTRSMFTHFPGDLITDVVKFFSKIIVFNSMYFSV